MMQVTALEPDSQLVTRMLRALYFPRWSEAWFLEVETEPLRSRKYPTLTQLNSSQNTPLCPGHSPAWSDGLPALRRSTFSHLALVVPNPSSK